MGRPQDGQTQVLALIVTCLLACFSHYVASTSAPADQLDCLHELPQPDQAFRVVWNHPDHCGNLSFTQYGIVFNTRRTFVGDEIQTLYKTGPWPTYPRTKDVDRGLPQLYTDRTFGETRQVLHNTFVANFTGLAVIDWEAWRANFYTNFGTLAKYKTQSIRLVRERHPDWDSSRVQQEAEREWEEGAKFVMGGKLAVGQDLMLGGHWGYYNYPRTWNGNSTPRQNNKMAWLWKRATGLYPSIYLTNPRQAVDQKKARVSRQVEEAVRIQKTFSPPNTVIYPYSNINQGHEIFFQEDHLRITLGLPADMGASGIVLWGSSSYYRHPGQCGRLSHYVHSVLGPYVKQLTQFMNDCSVELCGGNGRCVHNAHDTLLSREESDRLSASCRTGESRFHDYHCRCYSFWEGACCQTRAPSPCQLARPTAGASSTTRAAAGATTATANVDTVPTRGVMDNVIGK